MATMALRKAASIMILISHLTLLLIMQGETDGMKSSVPLYIFSYSEARVLKS